MAEMLQRDFSLPVVRVSLVEVKTDPVARFELVVNVDGHQEVRGERAIPLHALGFGTTDPNREPELGVPDDVTDWVGGWVHAELQPPSVLWLYLKKPYGLLGAVPWERDLQPAVGRPMIRLPDRLPSPSRSTSTFQVALLATAPAEEGPSTAAQMGSSVARAIADGVGDRLRLHVFGDLEAHDMLTHELARLPFGDVRLYQPQHGDQSTSKSRSGTPTNAWLSWIRQEMHSTALDAVHFVTHGYALGDEGAILTTPSPTSLDRRYPQAIQAGELRTFLTQVGALVAGFTRPVDNYSDYGLRRVVDDLGAVRAGPVLMNDPALDGSHQALADAYAFLSSPSPASPPASKGLVLFAQPRQVAGIDPEEVSESVRLDAFASSAAVEEHLAREETPVWLSAAERFIDENEAELIRFWQTSQSKSPTKSQKAYYSGVETALKKIRTVVNKHAAQQLNEDLL